MQASTTLALLLLAAAAAPAAATRGLRASSPAPAPAAAASTSSNGDRPPFKWGVANSAFQTEGANAVDGRGPSIWDKWIVDKYGLTDGSPIASYENWKKDVQVMKDLGVNTYRFSLSWPRLLPKGRGELNQKAVDHYAKVLDALNDAGITPMVGLNHFDLPEALQEEYGGWTSPRVVEDFGAYADQVFKALGGKAKHWLTLNEPKNMASLGYGVGVHAPFIKDPSGADQWQAALHMLEAHAAAQKAFKKSGPKGGTIGLALDCEGVLPLDPNSQADKDAAQRYIDFRLGTFADPIWFGKWPDAVKAGVPANILPALPANLTDFFKANKPDTFYINHYTTKIIWAVPGAKNGYGDGTGEFNERYEFANGTAIGKQADSSWLYVYPDGLRQVLNYVTKRYKPKDVVLSESGVDIPGESKLEGDAALDDGFRVDYYKVGRERVGGWMGKKKKSIKLKSCPFTYPLPHHTTTGLRRRRRQSRQRGQSAALAVRGVVAAGRAGVAGRHDETVWPRLHRPRHQGPHPQKVGLLAGQQVWHVEEKGRR